MAGKITTILSIFLILTNLVWSQKVISGKVIDQTDKQPLIGAFVQLQSSGTAGVTDEQGNFQIILQQESDFLLINYLGYDETRIEVGLKTSDLGIIELQRANTTLDEVIVSASPNNYKSEFKGSNFRINPIALKNLNPLSTEEVLRDVPGVNIVGDMGLSNRPNISIRGSWGRRSKRYC